MFLHDLYHEQKILQDRVIPPHYVLNAKHYRREFMNVNVPKDIYVHICGTDLIRGRDAARLAASGRQVTGIDLAEPMLAHARAHHPGPEYLRADLRELGLRPVKM
jgi:ubiquinone/menaquinone biosynthesis C-methylase UbiE